MSGRQKTLIAFCCLVIGYFLLRSYDNNSKTEYQLTIDSLKRELIIQDNDKQKLISIINESNRIIAAQDLVIESREQEIVRANKAAGKAITELNNIKFVAMNDSQRVAELRKLYPSWKE